MNVQFTETVLRDANQSLIATRLPYEKFEPILETMDKAGFYSAECWGGATFNVCLRYLNEDPWERLRKIRAKMPNTKLQMLLPRAEYSRLQALSGRYSPPLRAHVRPQRHRYNPHF